MLPCISRDISIVIDADDDEILGDRIRGAITDRLDDVESVTVCTRTSYGDLPKSAGVRLGLARHQVNALVRIVIRPLDRTLTGTEANELRDRMYLAAHRGPRLGLITDRESGGVGV